MKILIERFYKKSNYTVGKLYIDGKYICDTLEDTDRGFTNEQYDFEIRKLKVTGKSAIPKGTYKLSLSVYSAKFGSKSFYKNLCKGKLPRLVDVPGFSGILFHCGNDELDTEGCILLGYNTVPGKLLDSKAAFKKFYNIIKSGPNTIYVTVK